MRGKLWLALVAGILSTGAVTAAGVFVMGWPAAHGSASSPGIAAPASAVDADVTFAEYQAGFWAMVDCARTKGWLPVEEPKLTRRQVYEYQFFRPNSSPDASANERQSWERELFKCRSTHFDPVQWAWERKVTMSEAERQEARNFVGACMRQKGHAAPDHPSASDMDSMIRVVPGVTDPVARAAFTDCAAQMQDQFGLRRGEIP